MYTYKNAQGGYPRISTKAIQHMLNLKLNIQRNTKNTKLHYHHS